MEQGDPGRSSTTSSLTGDSQDMDVPKPNLRIAGSRLRARLPHRLRLRYLGQEVNRRL